MIPPGFWNETYLIIGIRLFEPGLFYNLNDIVELGTAFFSRTSSKVVLQRIGILFDLFSYDLSEGLTIIVRRRGATISNGGIITTRRIAHRLDVADNTFAFIVNCRWEFVIPHHERAVALSDDEPIRQIIGSET